MGHHQGAGHCVRDVEDPWLVYGGVFILDAMVSTRSSRIWGWGFDDPPQRCSLQVPSLSTRDVFRSRAAWAWTRRLTPWLVVNAVVL